MQVTPARLFNITGKITVDEVAARSGTGWKKGIKYPRAATASFNGSQAHKSSKNPSNPKQCVTLAMFSANGTRIGSVHIHEDGTYNGFPSHAGKAGINEPVDSSSKPSSETGSKA